MLVKNKLSIIRNIIIFLSAILIFLIGVFAGDIEWRFSEWIIKRDSEETVLDIVEYTPFTTQEESVIRVVEEVSPAVVSIIVSRDLPVVDRRRMDPFFFELWDEERETERRETGGGTGFIISSDGLVLTNRHVVVDVDAEYTVLTNDGRILEAEILSRDPIQDLAIMKIKEGGEFPTVRIGDSSQIKIGQTVVAIGNSLGEFRNTVSVGVVSGLGRSISATDGRTVQVLEDVIQTDAAINMGNSGGPLLNLRGEVIGINTAMALDAQNIGFSVPINKSRRMINSVKAGEELAYPFLGVRYLMIDHLLQTEKDLPIDYGAWITGSPGEPAINPDSGADRAGLMEGDIIIELDGVRIDYDNPLASVILNYNPGDEVELKILRNEREMIVKAVLGSRVW